MIFLGADFCIFNHGGQLSRIQFWKGTTQGSFPCLHQKTQFATVKFPIDVGKYSMQHSYLLITGQTKKKNSHETWNYDKLVLLHLHTKYHWPIISSCCSNREERKKLQHCYTNIKVKSQRRSYGSRMRPFSCFRTIKKEGWQITMTWMSPAVNIIVDL